jgi:F0F1-type ATP synthase assembly protein I
MAFHRPIPESKLPRAKAEGGIASVVQAEKLMQIAFVLPSAVLIGWLLGAWADHHFQQKWMMLTGIGFGCVAGLFSVIRMAIDAEKATRSEDTPSDGSGGN